MKRHSQSNPIHTTDEAVTRTVDDVLSQIPMGTFQYRLLIMTGMAFMADAMEVSLLSFMSECVGADWNLTKPEMASITSAVFAGELLGGLFFGPFADIYGRKLAYLVAVGLISVGGLASGASPDITTLIMLRAIVGFGVGGLTVPFDLLAEFLPKEYRGKVLLNIEYFWTLGSLFVAGMAWGILGQAGWRLLTYITAIPVIVASVISIGFLPESPRWLVEQGRIHEAEEILRFAARTNGIELGHFSLASPNTYTLGSSGENRQFGSPTPASVATQGGTTMVSEEIIGVMKKLVGEVYLSISMPLWTVWFSFGVGYYGIILFVTRLYALTDEGDGDDDNEAVCDFDYQSIFINSTMEIVGVYVAVNIIERYGRVGTQSGGYMLAALGVVIMGAGMNYAGVLAFSLIARAAIMAGSCATWVHTPELYDDSCRATAHSVSNVVARLGALISPYIVESNIHVGVVGLVLCIFNAIAGLAVLALPETAGKDLEGFEKPPGIGDNPIVAWLCKCHSGNAAEGTLLLAGSPSVRNSDEGAVLSQRDGRAITHVSSSSI